MPCNVLPTYATEVSIFVKHTSWQTTCGYHTLPLTPTALVTHEDWMKVLRWEKLSRLPSFLPHKC